jgi:putative transposase
VIDKEAIKKSIKKHGIKTTEDLQEFLRIITKEVIETLYDGEITDHLGYKKYESRPDKTNARNGKTTKKVKSQLGEINLEVPRDRQGTFEPEIVKKRQTDISGIEAKVISMYAKGMSTRDIKYHIHEIYGYDISAETISNITDLVMDEAKEWQNRPLQPIYPIVFMDAMIVKTRQEGIVKNYAVYAILGIDLEGNKECLGLYYSETESAKFWLNVLNELKARGVTDVFIFAVDNLTGISDAISSAFPNAEIQKCIVHQIRNSLKFVPWKERKTVASDLKLIYTASTEEQGRLNLDSFEEKWGKKYPHIVKSWRNNWGELSTFFKYSPEIRRLIYTTNPIEGFHRGLRKVSKTRAIFPNEDALTKLLYLAIRDMAKRWTMKIKNWGMIYSQLCIYFEERLENYL